LAHFVAHGARASPRTARARFRRGGARHGRRRAPSAVQARSAQLYRHPGGLRHSAGRQCHPARSGPVLPRTGHRAARGQLGQYAQPGALHRRARTISLAMDVPRRGPGADRAGHQFHWRRPARRVRPSLRSQLTLKVSEMPLFTGVVPPVVTPLNADFTVDYASFTRVLENLIDAGVHGLFVLGSTSEVVFHDSETRQAIVEHAIKVTNGRVPVLVGTIDPTTDRVIKHSRIAKAAGAAAVVVT